jgi:hypothetical protein
MTRYGLLLATALAVASCGDEQRDPDGADECTDDVWCSIAWELVESDCAGDTIGATMTGERYLGGLPQGADEGKPCVVRESAFDSAACAYSQTVACGLGAGDLIYELAVEQEEPSVYVGEVTADVGPGDCTRTWAARYDC